ncbi:MAG: glycosyltransferase [Candidatus Gastranaerophilales bacterium]
MNNYEIYKPMFEGDFIPLVFGCSNDYVPYLYVGISSIIENMNPNINYELNIMSYLYTEQSKKELLKLCEGHGNIKMRIIDAEPLIEAHQNYLKRFWQTRPNVSNSQIAVCLTLFFEAFFDGYSKMLYLDSDLIVNNDVSELFGIELGKNTIGATLDYQVIMATHNGLSVGGVNLKEYYVNELKLDMSKYINAGVILFDLNKLKNIDYMKKALDYSSKNEFPLSDQTLYNLFFNNDIKILPIEWNYQAAFYDEGFQNSRKEMGLPMEKVDSPKAFHYVAKKVVHDQKLEMEMKFWQYARKTPYYEALLHRRLVYPYHIVTSCTGLNESNKCTKKMVVSLKYFAYRILANFSKKYKAKKDKYKKLVKG